MSLDPLAGFGITLFLCTSLSTLAYVKGVLTWDGSVAAWIVGFIIGIFGDLLWLVLLLLFLLTSFAATRYKFKVKEAQGVQEGQRGERRFSNVLANGTVPSLVALASGPLGLLPKEVAGVVFVASVAVAASDTMASEIGVLSPHAFSIANFRPVKAGTDGGISLLGEGAALGAALYTALAALLFLHAIPTLLQLPPTLPLSLWSFFIILFTGFWGCQFDSVLGATLEVRGRIGKKSVNLLATSCGSLLALGLLRWIAPGLWG